LSRFLVTDYFLLDIFFKSLEFIQNRLKLFLFLLFNFLFFFDFLLFFLPSLLLFARFIFSRFPIAHSFIGDFGVTGLLA